MYRRKYGNEEASKLEKGGWLTEYLTIILSELRILGHLHFMLISDLKWAIYTNIYQTSPYSQSQSFRVIFTPLPGIETKRSFISFLRNSCWSYLGRVIFLCLRGNDESLGECFSCGSASPLFYLILLVCPARVQNRGKDTY